MITLYSAYKLLTLYVLLRRLSEYVKFAQLGIHICQYANRLMYKKQDPVEDCKAEWVSLSFADTVCDVITTCSEVTYYTVIGVSSVCIIIN